MPLTHDTSKERGVRSQDTDRVLGVSRTILLLMFRKQVSLHVPTQLLYARRTGRPMYPQAGDARSGWLR